MAEAAKSMSFETLLLDIEDGIATITLNRPDKMNAFTTQMMLDMIAAFDETDSNDAVKAVIVTGSGRAFCAGADLSAGAATFNYAERGESARDETKVGTVYRDGGGRVTLRIYDSLKPVIGAINGAAVGIGATMQLPMDIRLATPDAKYALCLRAGALCRKPVRPGSCRAWLASRRRWNGAIRAGSLAAQRPRSVGWCGLSMRPRTYCPPLAPLRATLSTIPPPSRSP